MAVHSPGFLPWRNVLLVAALSGKDIIFIDPVTMSGQKVTGSRLKQYKAEFGKVRKIAQRPGQTIFN
jgi:hypothetical protein